MSSILNLNVDSFHTVCMQSSVSGAVLEHNGIFLLNKWTVGTVRLVVQCQECIDEQLQLKGKLFF